MLSAVVKMTLLSCQRWIDTRRIRSTSSYGMVTIASADQVPNASLAFQPSPMTGSPNFVTISQPMVRAAPPVQPLEHCLLTSQSLQQGPQIWRPLSSRWSGAVYSIQSAGAHSAYPPDPAIGSLNMTTIAAHPVQPTGALSSYQPGNVTVSSTLVTIAQTVVWAVHPDQPTGVQFAQYQQRQQCQQQQQIQLQLQAFWAEQHEDCEKVTDFRNHSFPLARITKIMKADEDAAEAPILHAKACEMFILELTKRAWNNVEENNRRTLQKSNMFAAITKTDLFDVLIERPDTNQSATDCYRPTFSPSHQHMPPVRAPSMYTANQVVGPSRLMPAAPIHVAQVPVLDKVED